MRRVIRALAALTALTAAGALILTGCTAQAPDEDSGEPPSPQFARSRRLAQPIGLKWNAYSYPAAYGPVIERYRSGTTFHDITWCAVEPSPGDLRWALEDKVVADLLRYGLEVSIRIRTGTCWVNDGPAAPQPRTAASLPPADLAAYQSFVRLLVGRYAQRGVHSYAIENEIDTENHWAADPSAYPPVARAGVTAIRAADPQATVADPGLSSSGYGLAVARTMTDSAEAVGFYQAFYERRGNSRLPKITDAAGLREAERTPAGRRIVAAHDAVRELHEAELFDVFQLHYYDPWRHAPGTLAYVRGMTDAPIEAWEVGSFWPGSSYDPRRHANETVQLVTTLLAGGVQRVVYLPLFHTPGSIAPKETWRGLYESDGRARPAATVLEQIRDIADAGSWHAVSRPGVQGAVVLRDSGAVLVVWSADDGTHMLQGPDGTEHNVGEAPSIIPTSATESEALRWLRAP